MDTHQEAEYYVVEPTLTYAIAAMLTTLFSVLALEEQRKAWEAVEFEWFEPGM